eukprot:CAMPEP_0184322272 /NCGR_PEP_ID=MMETSP1049-20130417/123740_1 /TAXON_ID=77928 /ORGANISM="Proteomonas sulcata, Strain CCMP704" /LENGTH=90 /DNA_ID=CAMNT_0026643349 /DNA_START=96 /DNA_END=365 /DNA_ORIENTATION=+
MNIVMAFGLLSMSIFYLAVRFPGFLAFNPWTGLIGVRGVAVPFALSSSLLLATEPERGVIADSGLLGVPARELPCEMTGDSKSFQGAPCK